MTYQKRGSGLVVPEWIPVVTMDSMSPRAISRVSLSALALVLVAMTAFSVISAANNRSATREAQRASQLSGAYETAARSLAELEAIALAYIADPRQTGVLADFEPAVNQIVGSLTVAIAIGDQTDRDLIEDLRQRYFPDLDIARRYFAALQQGTTFEEQLPDRDTINALRTRLTMPAAQRKSEATRLLDAQQRNETRRLEITLVVYGLGLGFVFLLIQTLRASGQRELRSEREIVRLIREASLDSLTGLKNHRAFLDQLDSLLDGMGPSSQASLAFVDLDDFKQTNDRMGHEFGDSILRAFADQLQATVGTLGQTFRIGGDEFALIFDHIDRSEAAVIVGKIRDAAAAQLHTSISAGVTDIRFTERDSRLIREEADWALYEAKRRGRNGIVNYDPNDADGVPLLSAAKVAALTRILESGSVDVMFQPICNQATGQVIAYEALARKFGSLSGPQEAFDLAERRGWVPALDSICRSSILRRVRDLPTDALLFINISPSALVHESFSAEAFRRDVFAAGLTPGRIVVEVTERSMIRTDVIARCASELKAHGFNLALDDVGAGNAGLEMLRRIPFDFVKVDHSVVRSAITNTTGNAVLVAIVAFASAAGARVIAEGIETEEMLAHIRALPGATRLDVGAIQGYLIGRPTESFHDQLREAS